MKRTNIYLPEVQLSGLRKAAKKTGVTVAELIRRAIEEWLKRNNG